MVIALTAFGPLLVILALVLTVTIQAESGEAVLWAGVARTDITPPVEERAIRLNGYGERKNKPATGVHDPIHAKALVLDDGSARVAIASADLLWIGQALRQRVMDRLEAKGLGPDNLLLCATHNHSGPAGLDQNAVYQYAFGEFDAELFEDVAGRLAAVINDAAGDLKPATLTATAKEVPDLIRNRRGDGAVDPVLTVVKVADLAGEPMAVLVNYGAHPTIVGADNMLISGGYPGALQAAVEERLGNGASVLFSVGSEADQMPEYNGQGDGFTRANDYARQLSDEVWALLQQPGEAAVGPLRCLTQTVVLPPPKVPQNWRHVATDQFMRTLFPAQSTMLTIVRLADVVLVGVPGEIVASLGLQIKQRAQRRSIKHAVIVGLANDYVGYMLTREQYLGGGYESDTGSLYGEDFGELMLRSAADAVDSLLEGRTAA